MGVLGEGVELSIGQVRGLVGITRDTWREWQPRLVPVKDRDGRSADVVYTVQEALALKVVAYLAHSGVRVRALTSVSVELFKVCESQWAVLANQVLVIDLAGSQIQQRPRDEVRSLDEMAGLQVVPIYKLASELQSDVLKRPDPSRPRRPVRRMAFKTGARK